MLPHDGQTTDGALLERLGDWADHRAWAEFARRYDPVIRRHCRACGFDPETTEELCQRVWVELAGRMRAYRCDPGRRFRGWLRRLCRSRAIDLWRQRRADPLRRCAAGPPEGLAAPAPIDLDDADAPDPARPALLRRAERVQRAVRRRVDERTWQVFWDVAVEGGPVRAAAERAGISYAAAFAAQKRVRRMLREEAARLDLEPDLEPIPEARP